MCKRKSLENGEKGLTAKERKAMGFTDRINGLAAQYPNDGYYMQGYRSEEIKKSKLEQLNNSVAEAQALALKLGVLIAV